MRAERTMKAINKQEDFDAPCSRALAFVLKTLSVLRVNTTNSA